MYGTCLQLHVLIMNSCWQHSSAPSEVHHAHCNPRVSLFTTSEADNSNPVIITISPEERARGVASQATILKAIVAIAEDGLVVLDNAIDLSHIDALNRRMVKEAEDLINRPTTHFK